MEVIKWDLITFFVNFLWYSLFYSEFKVSVVQVLFCTSFWLVILRFMMRMTTDFMKRFQLENFMWVIFIISFWPFICRCRRCLQSKWIDLYSVIHFLCIKIIILLVPISLATGVLLYCCDVVWGVGLLLT